MRSLNDLAATLLPILFVLLCLRIGFEAIAPAILPLFAVAVIALAIWLWIRLRV